MDGDVGREGRTNGSSEEKGGPGRGRRGRKGLERDGEGR